MKSLSRWTPARGVQRAIQYAPDRALGHRHRDDLRAELEKLPAEELRAALEANVLERPNVDEGVSASLVGYLAFFPALYDSLVMIVEDFGWKQQQQRGGGGEVKVNLRNAIQFSLSGKNLRALRYIIGEHARRGDSGETISSLQGLGGLRMVFSACAMEENDDAMEYVREICEVSPLGAHVLNPAVRVTKAPYVNTSLIGMVRRGDVLDYLVERWNQDVNDGIPMTECDKLRPLHGAVSKTVIPGKERIKLDCVRAFLKHGAHVDARTVNAYGSVVGKPIHLACARPFGKTQVEVVRMLIENGADPREPSLMEKRTPLDIAIFTSKDEALIRFLIEKVGVLEGDDTTREALLRKLREKKEDTRLISLVERALERKQSGAEENFEEEEEEEEVANPSNAVRRTFVGLDSLEEGERVVITAEGELRVTREANSSSITSEVKSRLISIAERLEKCMKNHPLTSDASEDWSGFWCEISSNSTSSSRPRRSSSSSSSSSSVEDNRVKSEIVSRLLNVDLLRHATMSTVAPPPPPSSAKRTRRATEPKVEKHDDHVISLSEALQLGDYNGLEQEEEQQQAQTEDVSHADAETRMRYVRRAFETSSSSNFTSISPIFCLSFDEDVVCALRIVGKLVTESSSGVNFVVGLVSTRVWT